MSGWAAVCIMVCDKMIFRRLFMLCVSDVNKFLFVIFLILGISRLRASDEKLKFFEEKIRPLFVEKCYKCHSKEAAKNNKLKGGFYIDFREGLMRGGEGGPAVIPGQPDKSMLMKTIRHEIPEMQMPPKKAKLTEAQIADVEKWIKDGCVDPRNGTLPKAHDNLIDYEKARQFWSFAPFRKFEVPKIENSSWGRNSIDNFILNKLESEGIPTAPVAQSGTLLRRLYLNLTGLAPSEEDVREFQRSQDPLAWEKLIDKLLSSQHYGERWGRHWLDLARFAESNGYAFDKDRNGAFHYRDFVIKAFNKDMPYDEFVRLQLAGDLINPKNYEHLAATGFIAAGPFTSQQTAKERERSRYEQLDDLISTIGTAMLGLSIGCARCHDHKFDPISANDYYRMITAFERTGFETVGTDFKPEIYAEAKKKFDEAHQPFLKKLANYEKNELKAVTGKWLKKWQSTEVDNSSLLKDQPIWEQKQIARINGGGIKQYPLEVTSAFSTDKAIINTSVNGILMVSGANPATAKYTIEGTVNSKGAIDSLVLEVFADDSLKAKGPGRASNGNFVLTDFIVEVNGQKVKLIKSMADFSQNGYPVANAFDSNRKSGWALAGSLGKDHKAIFQLEKPIISNGSVNFKIILDQQFGGNHTIGKFRISALTDFPESVNEVKGSALPADISAVLLEKNRTNSQKKRIQNYFLATNGSQAFTVGNWYYLETKQKIDVTQLNPKSIDSNTWKEQNWTENKDINLKNGYILKTIESIRDYPVKMTLKVNGDVEFWLNGKIFDKRQGLELNADLNYSFFLQKGINLLVLKITDKKPSFNFKFKPGIDATVKYLLDKTKLADDEIDKISNWYSVYDKKWQEINNEIVDHKKLEPKPNLTYIYQAKKNGKTYGRFDIHHLVRGNSDAKLQRATPGFMEVLVTSENNEQYWLTGQGEIEPRVAFANWITDEKNGAGRLLARVIVNRVWKQHMGKGLVASPSDFGEMGERPTHPELLDWLAQTLINNNWSLKSIHKLILNSAVFRQGIASDTTGQSKDPANNLYWTRRKQRLEAEVIRDRLLQLSGLLDKRMFGPGSLSLSDPRRSVYLTVKRSKLVPFLQLFDAPDAILGQGERNETNSAPQSLTLMNSPFVREMSAKLASRIKATDSEELINKIYWQTLSRAPSEKEIQYLTNFLNNQVTLYENDKNARNKAVIDLCQLLICCNEFVYID